METLWFAIVAFMLCMYVILDGFDLGAGVLHLLVARTEEERRTVLQAIGPVWDGNEVWLLAAGGTLYFAFPLLYASSFSGFYLPLMIVLWLLILRAAGIELRHQLDSPLWKSLWDVSFAGSSILLAVFFGAALGNVLRGVPLNHEGYFFEPLWTTFTVVPQSGILDWFTILMGMLALFTITAHGGHFLALKSEGVLQVRARRAASIAWWGTVILSAATLLAAHAIRPGIWDNYSRHPWGWIFPIVGFAGIIGMLVFGRRGRDGRAFISSSVFIGSMLAATAFGLYPAVLPASTNPDYTLTVHNTAAQHYGLEVGFIWWIIGITLAAGYFFYVYRSFRGKVHLSEGGY